MEGRVTSGTTPVIIAITEGVVSYAIYPVNDTAVFVKEGW